MPERSMRRIFFFVFFAVFCTSFIVAAQFVPNEAVIPGVSSYSETSLLESNDWINIISPTENDFFYNKSLIRLNVETEDKCDLSYSDSIFNVWDFYEEFYDGWDLNLSETPINNRYKPLCRDC